MNIKTIADYYGYDRQARQCIEEMAELQQAINKFWRYVLKNGKMDFKERKKDTLQEKNIIEEIADVEICIEQLKLFFSCTREVEKEKTKKINKQMDRILINKLNELFKGDMQ